MAKDSKQRAEVVCYFGDMLPPIFLELILATYYKSHLWENALHRKLSNEFKKCWGNSLKYIEFQLLKPLSKVQLQFTILTILFS